MQQQNPAKNPQSTNQNIPPITKPIKTKQIPTQAPNLPPVQKSPTPIPKQPQSTTIQNKNLIASLYYLKQNKLLPENKSKVKFETTKDAEDSTKEDIISIIKEHINRTKETISELQKAGYNLHLEGIKLLAIPLKIKVWQATLKVHELENIFKILREVNIITTPLKKQNETRIAEKEKLEKIAEQKEKNTSTPPQKSPITKQLVKSKSVSTKPKLPNPKQSLVKSKSL